MAQQRCAAQALAAAFASSFVGALSAVPLGGLLIWGLQPGPMLFVDHKESVWILIASLYLGNLVGLFVVLATVPL